jgi:hypothetical protein
VLDLTEQDFQDISNLTSCIFEIAVQRSAGSVSTVVCPNSEFLKQDLREKQYWLNASLEKSWSAVHTLDVLPDILTRRPFTPG